MKAVTICCLMALLCLNANAQIQKSDLQGAWKLVAWQKIENGKIVNVYPGYASIDQTKIWSGNNVMVVGHYKSNKHDKDDYSLGTWKLNGDLYEELNTIVSCDCSLVRMKMEIKNDTLFQIFPLNEKFEVDKKTNLIFKYLKLN